MILTTVLLILITLGVILYSLFFKRSFKKVRLKEVYREKYHSDTEALERSLNAGKLTQAEYEHQKTELARDLLAVSREDRQFSMPTLALFVLLGAFVTGLTATYFWKTDYAEAEKTFDLERDHYLPIVEAWLDEMDLEALRNGATPADFPPPDDLISSEEGYRGAFRVLNYLSTKDEHQDAKLLYVLASFYLGYAQYEKGFLDTVYDIYVDLYSVEKEPSFFLQSSLVRLQYLRGNEELTPRIEGLFDTLATNYPDEEAFLLDYVDVLQKHNKAEKANAYLRHFYYRSALAPNITLTAEEEPFIAELTEWADRLNIEWLRNRHLTDEMPYPDNFIQLLTSDPDSAKRVVQVFNASVENDDPKRLYVLLDLFLKRNEFFLLPPVLEALESIEPQNYHIDRVYLNLEFSMAYLLGDAAKGRLTPELVNRFNALVRNYPDDVTQFFEYGLILGNNGLYDGAITQLESFKEGILDPNAKSATESVIRDFRARKASEANALNEAKEESAVAESGYRVELSLAPNFNVDAVNPNGILFVYLRPEGSAGGPPLAAKRIPLREIQSWPLTVTIGENDRLMGGGKPFAEMKGIAVSARISQTGDPVAGAGDYETGIVVIRGDQEDSLSLILDRMVE